jgi:uncharacterized membrane protein YphA (DoxX/SURF4 family)
MSSSSKLGLCILQYSLAIVILIEAIRFVLPSAAHDFAHLHLPSFLRFVLGYGEILGCVLLAIPGTAILGAWCLFIVFIMAIAIHLLHGQINVSNLVIYAAAAFAVAESKG